jgi:hypothetical protein
MNLSEVFYEAACRICNGESDCRVHTCCVVLEVDTGDGPIEEWNDLMLTGTRCSYGSEEVNLAAHELDWPSRDFRTFMLLMASEAVK